MTYRSLTRATAPVVEPVSLAEAKLHLRVDIEDDDQYILGLIAAAREYVEAYLDRSLVYTQWTMRLDRFPYEIELPRPPMATAGTYTATVVSYTLEGGSTATLSTAEYRVDRNSTPGVVRTNYAGTWPSHLYDRNSVSVTWWAGYGEDGTKVPRAIRNAILLLVGHWYENRSAVLVGSISKELEFSVHSLLGTVNWGQYR
jgi:uncharacterized phiE125 gp8 family phage protein